MLKQQVKHYALEDIFNFDETALFYRLQPNKTLASHSVKGDKVNKERLTIALCTNVTGTFKCKAVVIGRYMRINESRLYKDCYPMTNYFIIYHIQIHVMKSNYIIIFI